MKCIAAAALLLVLLSTALLVTANNSDSELSAHRQLMMRKIAGRIRYQRENKHKFNNNNVAAPTPTGNLTLLADGFVWAENIWFDGLGGMFVSDDNAGKIYKLTRDVPYGPAKKELWVDGGDKAGFKHVLGQQLDPTSNGLRMLAAVSFSKKGACNGSDYGFLAFSTQTPNVSHTYVCTQNLGNGVAMAYLSNTATLPTLFSASEGGFIPGKGIVQRTNLITRNTDVVSSKWWACDGMWCQNCGMNNSTLPLSAGRLTVSEVLTATMLVFDGLNGTSGINKVGQYKAPGCAMVDDFCVVQRDPKTGEQSSSEYLYAADFWGDKVVAFLADGSSTEFTVLSTGLQSPTSVRPGFGKHWDNPRSLYISEGGGLFSFQNTHRVWELQL